MTSIPKSDFARRRTELLAKMGAGSIAIVPVAAVAYRNSELAIPIARTATSST